MDEIDRCRVHGHHLRELCPQDPVDEGNHRRRSAKRRRAERARSQPGGESGRPHQLGSGACEQVACTGERIRSLSRVRSCAGLGLIASHRGTVSPRCHRQGSRPWLQTGRAACLRCCRFRCCPTQWSSDRQERQAGERRPLSDFRLHRRGDALAAGARRERGRLDARQRGGRRPLARPLPCSASPRARRSEAIGRLQSPNAAEDDWQRLRSMEPAPKVERVVSAGRRRVAVAETLQS